MMNAVIVMLYYIQLCVDASCPASHPGPSPCPGRSQNALSSTVAEHRDRVGTMVDPTVGSSGLSSLFPALCMSQGESLVGC